MLHDEIERPLEGAEHWEELHAELQKFSEALDKDPTNPALIAIGTQFYVALTRSLDISWDPRQSVKLQAAYAKARARDSAAFHSFSECRELQNGLVCLSKLEQLALQDQRMKTSLESSLKEANDERIKAESNKVVIPEHILESRKLPWDVAKSAHDKIVAEMVPEMKPSCVFVVHSAREELNKAMKAFEMLQFTEDDQEPSLKGCLSVFLHFSNSILLDRRVFGTRNLYNFLVRIRMQADFENALCGGWIYSDGGATTIQKEAPERQEAKGWHTVRIALEVTITYWIFTAWLRQQIGHCDAVPEMFFNTLNVLEWGRIRWSDVPKEERGTIFERSFIRSVKTLFLETMYENVYRNGPTKTTYEELIQLAEGIVDDANSDPPPLDMPCRLAYWSYPKGIASSILGWAHFKKATARSLRDIQLRASMLEKASQYYFSAADNFPEDDEYHTRFLVKALECWCTMGTVPLRRTLALCKTIRTRFDQAIEIWSAPPFGLSLRAQFGRAKEFEDKYEEMISEGKCSLDSISGTLPDARR